MAIETILESMIIKTKLEKIMPTKTDTSWSGEMREVVSEFRKGAEQYSDEQIDDLVDEAVNAVRAKPNRGGENGGA